MEAPGMALLTASRGPLTAQDDLFLGRGSETRDLKLTSSL